MRSEDLERMKSAHAKALSLQPSERDDFLQNQFPNEPELQEALKKLLEWHDQAGQFLSTPLATRILEPLARDFKIQRVGPWELIRELGRGGSATVYLARRADDLFEKQVAIKVLNRLSHSDEVFRRFQREIQVLARVEHPYIVRLLEAGTTGEALAYIVTELVDGIRIDEFAEPLPLREKLRLFLKVCEGLSCAHENLIVHRDLKPSNILVTNDGNPKLLDFGIALLLDQDSRLTETGLERMTLQYASPEQVRREKDITISSDVYSLGVILYEIIAGRSPYASTQSELGHQIVSEDPLPLSGARRDLEAIIRKALRKSPPERYESVKSLGDDITRLLEGRPVVARGDGAVYRIGKFAKKQWRRIGLVATGAALVLLIGLGFHVARVQGNRPVPVALESPEGRPLALSFSPDGNRLYYTVGDVFFDYTDLFTKDLSTGKVAQLTNDGAFKIAPTVSPDGKFVAFHRAAGESTTTLAVLPAIGGEEQKLFTGPSDGSTWGRDSRSMIVGYRSEGGIWPHLRGFDITRNEWWNITTPPTEGRGDHYPVLSPDGETLCFVRQESRESADLFLLQLDARLRPQGSPRRLTSRRFRITFPQWTPDGKEIIYAGGTLGNFRLFRVATDGRSEPREMPEAGPGISALSVSRNARYLVFGQRRTESDVFRLDFDEPGGSLVLRTKIITSSDGAVLSPDGMSIVFVSEKSGEPQIWIANADGTNARQLTSYPATDIISPLWLVDSSGLVVSVRSRTFGLRNFVIRLPGGPEHELTGVTGIPCNFSRDGKWLYFSRIKKDVDIYKYSMETGDVREVTRDARGSYAVESPDGHTVYFYKPEAELGLWKVPATGGVASQVLPNLARRTLFAVRGEGIYYVERERRSAVVKLRRFPEGKDVALYRMKSVPSWGFSVSTTGRSIFFAQEELLTSEILLFKDLH